MVAVLDGEVRTRGQEGGALDRALDTAESAGAMGFVAVPPKPTAAMLAAGSQAGNVSVEAVWRIYQAMIQNAD